jgi:hypothetical protein
MKLSLSPTYLKALFLETVWNSSKTELSGWQAGVITSLRITHLIIRDLMEGMITLKPKMMLNNFKKKLMNLLSDY